MLVVQDLFISANIDFTDYIRTTEERHIAVVEPFWVRRLAVLHDKKKTVVFANYSLFSYKCACTHTVHDNNTHILTYMIN